MRTIPSWRRYPRSAVGLLFAYKESKGGQTVYRFDIRVQGENETVFFEN